MNEHNVQTARPGAPLPEGTVRSYTRERDEPGAPMTREAAEPGGRRRGHSREPLTRTERLFVTMFVTMFATTLGAGALGLTTLSSQLLDMQEQVGGQILGLQKQIGELSERMARVETLIETRLVAAPVARDPAGP